jgi:hypothetical protein
MRSGNRISLFIPAVEDFELNILAFTRPFLSENRERPRLRGGARVTQTGGAKEDSNSSKKYSELARFWLSKLHK